MTASCSYGSFQIPDFESGNQASYGYSEDRFCSPYMHTNNLDPRSAPPTTDSWWKSGKGNRNYHIDSTARWLNRELETAYWWLQWASESEIKQLRKHFFHYRSYLWHTIAENNDQLQVLVWKWILSRFISDNWYFACTWSMFKIIKSHTRLRAGVDSIRSRWSEWSGNIKIREESLVSISTMSLDRQRILNGIR